MSLSALPPLHAAARLHATTPPTAAAPTLAAAGLPTEQSLLADDGVGGQLLQAGPRSQRLAIDELERQFRGALADASVDAGR